MKKIYFILIFLLFITGCNSELKTTVETLQAKVDISQDELNDRESTINDLTNKVDSLGDLLKESEAQIKEKEAEIKEKEANIKKLESLTSEALEKKLKETEKELTGKKEEVKELKELVNELTYYKKIVDSAQAQKNEAAKNRNNPVEIIINNFYASAGGVYIAVEGELKNISDLSLKFVKLRATFTDDNGNIIDSSDTYMNSDLLQPNALTKFRTTVNADKRISNVNVEVIDYRNE